MSQNNKPPRRRAQNFSATENRALIDLVMEYQDVIESKKSGTAAWIEKRNVWTEIEKKFNTTDMEYYRTAEALRMRYEGMKKDIRRKAMLKSGGDHTKCDCYHSSSVLMIKQELNKTSTEALRSSQSSSQNDLSPTNLSPEDTNTISRNWRPTSLKARRANVLHIKKNSINSTRNKFTKLARAKSELLQMQFEAQKVSVEFKSKEYDMKLQLLQAELDLTIQQKLNKQIMYEKKIELLNKQLLEQNLKTELLKMELKKLQ